MKMRRLICWAAVGTVVILALFGAGQFQGALAQEGVHLSPESVEAVAMELAMLVDEQAAALYSATQPNVWNDFADHFLVSAMNMLAGFGLALLVGIVLHRKAVERGLLRSADEIRDAAQLVREGWTARREKRELTDNEQLATRQAGLILVASSIPTAAYIIGIYLLMASLATPHG